MLKRLGNLWALSSFRPETKNGEVELTQIEYTKPKGMAKIVEMEEPIDQFPEDTN